MDVMEDGNLMDKVHILIKRDMEYYKSKQYILQETICPAVIGGRLDFPRSASFASIKLVLWWEEEFTAAHKKPSGFFKKIKEQSIDKPGSPSDINGGMVKDSDPSKFVGLISKSADQLLEHLHVLTQEALDHADLSVLTGTIGAAALLKNCLWFYIQAINDIKNIRIDQLQLGYRKYYEMCEALAERLLDLHCRLVSLYILQDAECLNWESCKPFFESERGSYTIQMWWLYMQGTKEDLWNTVPPKMAQRVFAGMLNESLTILTVRYTQSIPTEARTLQLVVDMSNLLLCVAQLLPSICDTAMEFTGCFTNTTSKILRDIHAKCQELLSCLLLRGCPLHELSKGLKKGVSNIKICKSRTPGPAPWIMFALPNIFKAHCKHISKISDMNSAVSIALELMVLLAQPQPNWAHLLKVLCMRKCRVLEIILRAAFANYTVEMRKTRNKESDCGAFLCCGDGSCRNVTIIAPTVKPLHYYNLILSATEVMLYVGNDQDLTDVLLPIITQHANWDKCFERRHVWNQIRPPWYEAILNFTLPSIPTTADTVINAVQTGATMYQSMSLTLACFSHFWDSINPALRRILYLLQEQISSETVPLNNSCLIQSLVSALYSYLLKKSQDTERSVRYTNSNSESTNSSTTDDIALAVAESLCSIDEDDKHTDQIDEFLKQVTDNKQNFESNTGCLKMVETNQQTAEVLVSDILMSSNGKNSLKILHHFIKCNREWLFQKLAMSDNNDLNLVPDKTVMLNSSLLRTMFYIGYKPFDQLLTGEWKPDWTSLLNIPMGLSAERIWMQLSLRWEFRNPCSSSLTLHDVNIIHSVSSVFKQ